jgi:hypothetical protein
MGHRQIVVQNVALILIVQATRLALMKSAEILVQGLAEFLLTVMW